MTATDRNLDDRATTKILRGAMTGLIAGVAASLVMDRFQAVVAALSRPDDGEDGQAEPATQQAADAVAKALIGHDVPEAEKPLAGQAIHYALGIGLGVAYGIAAEFRPAVTGGYGVGFGIGTATLLDEAAVPAFGLGAAPWRSDWPTLLYGYASHIVFGGTVEAVRRQVRGTLIP